MLETARGGIARRGLGYDWSDVGVLTNIGPDHIGQDDIEALRSELERLGAGDTVVFFYDKLEPVLKLLNEFGAKQVTTMSEPNFDFAEQTTQAATAIGA